MLFVALGATQLGSALGVRARPRTLQNPFLLVATAVALGLQVLAVQLPLLQDLLGTESLTLPELAVASGTLVVGYLAGRVQTSLAVAGAAAAGR